MAAEDQIKKLRQFRNEIEIHLTNIQELLRILRSSENLPADERQAKVDIALDDFKKKLAISGIRDLIQFQIFVESLNDLGYIQTNPGAQELWKTLLKGKILDQQESFQDRKTLLDIASFLHISLDEIVTQDQILSEELVKKTSQEQRSKSTNVPVQPPTTQSDQTNAHSDIGAKARAKQQASIKKSKDAYQRHQREIELINSALPENRKFEFVHDKSIRDAVLLSTMFPQIDVDYFINLSGAPNRIGNNKEALELLRAYFLSERNTLLEERAAQGLSTNVLNSGDENVNQQLRTNLAAAGKVVGVPTVVRAFTSKRTDLENTTDSETQVALRVHDEFAALRTEGERPTSIFSRGLQILQQAVGIESAQQVAAQHREEMEALRGVALADSWGDPQEVPVFDEEGNAISSDENRSSLNPQSLRSRAQQLQKASGLAKKIATNPYVITGGVIGAGALYGLLTQGVSGGVGVLATGLTGAGAGFLIGGPVGFVIGGIGGTIAGVLGLGIQTPTITIGALESTSVTGLIGNVGANLFAQNPVIQATGRALDALSSMAPSGGAAVTSVGSSAASGVSNFISGISTATPAFGSAFSAATLVTVPIAGVGLVTAAIVIPTLLAAFLIGGKTSGVPGLGACWPTDGTIKVLETYPADIVKDGKTIFAAGSKHATFQSGADPVDITGVRGTGIYTPFSGTANAYIDNSAGGAKVVTVSTTQGFTVLFAHMDSFAIPEGESQVAAGAIIGYMGDTGYADGVHLHFEVLGKKLSEILPPTPPLAIGSVVRHDECSGAPNLNKQCYKDYPQIVAKAKEITNTLQRGVWGNWNYTPLYPQHADYSKPPGVTDDYYDNVLGPSRIASGLEAWQPDDLFWCAWLVTYSYKDAVPPVEVPSSAAVNGLYRNWEKNGRILRKVGEIRPSDVPLGSAMGFDKVYRTWTDPNAHVGVVCGKQFDTSGENGFITSCESNNGSVSNTYNVVNGQIQDLKLDSYITLRTVWFGLPPQDDPTGKCGP